MSSPGPSNGALKEAHTGNEHARRNFPKPHMHGKEPTSAQDNEEAPLLADDDSNEGLEANADEESSARRLAKKQGRAGKRVQKAGHWLWSNKMILAITLLLIGGVIALIVYFTGMCDPLYLLLFSSRCCSWLPPRTTV